MATQATVYGPNTKSATNAALVAANVITQSADSTLTGEQSLGALTTGLLLNTVSAGTGVLSTAVAGTNYVLPTGVAGGQTVTGGTASGESLALKSTSHSTKGSVTLGDATMVQVDGLNVQLSLSGTGGAKSMASAANLTWDSILVPATTLTLSGSTGHTGSGTNSPCLISVRRPTIAFAGGANLSYSTVLYIENSPLLTGGGSNLNPYAIWVDAGLARFDGGTLGVFEFSGDATVGVATHSGRVPIFIPGLGGRYLRYFTD